MAVTRLALFDCDGTLVDSAGNICRAMEDTFARHALPCPPRTEIRRIVGLSLNEAMAMLHPSGAEDHHRAMAEDYRACFTALRGTPDFRHEPLFEGVEAAVVGLIDAGFALGVATGKSDRGLSLVLAQHGLIDRFVTLQTADRHPSKPHPAMALAAIAEAGATPETTVVIGDTSYDMAMAGAAGAHALGVGWGYHDADELLVSGAAMVIDDATLIPQAVVACLDGAPISRG